MREVNITTRSAAASATTWQSTSPVSLPLSRNMQASGICELSYSFRKKSVAQRSELTFITENIRVWQSTLVWKLETLREINYIVASKLAFFYELQFILKQTKK